MARLHTGIIVFCLLSAFASSVLAASPNDEAVFQDLKRKFSDPTASTCDRDPECVISTYIAPWEQFMRTYPTTKRSTTAINPTTSLECVDRIYPRSIAVLRS